MASIEHHGGIHYLTYLNQIHRSVEPSSYLEIGVETGRSLAFARCPAVAIDPVFKIRDNTFSGRRETYLFQMTSDEFFARHRLDRFLPGGIDFAFLDGLHHFENLLRDLVNAERHAHEGTAIAMHDCYPVNTEMANRKTNFDARVDQETRFWWAGDVWKLLPILRDYRPDLDVTVLDCPPTGLVVIRGLDPQSQAIPDSYTEILGKYSDLTLDDFGIERLREEFQTTDSRSLFEPNAVRNFIRPNHSPTQMQTEQLTTSPTDSPSDRAMP